MARLNYPFMVALDTNGDPISGAKLEFFESGTSTPLDSYSEETLTTANANPLVADSAGRFSDVFLKSQDYKITLSDASDVLIDTWDPVGPESVADFFQDIDGSLQSTGSSNAYVVTSNQTVGSLAAGIRITFIANHVNTGAATLALDGLTAKTIKKWHDQDLSAGDVEADQIIDVVYKATEDVWQMLNPTAQIWTYETLNTTTGGTAIAFTGIPSGVTDIDVFCLGVSLSGTQEVNIQIGPSGGLETSGYVGSVTNISTTVLDTAFSSSFFLNESAAAADTYILVAHLHLVDAATNLWFMTGKGHTSAGGGGARYTSVGQKALAGAVSLLTVKSNSSDTFDVNGGVVIRHR